MSDHARADASIIGIGLATPERSIAQKDAAEFCVKLCGLEGDGARLARALHGRSGIDRRGCVLLGSAAASGEGSRPDGAIGDQSFFSARSGSGDRGPTTAARMAVYERFAPALAARAAREALRDARMEPGAITHLVTVTCTGFGAPGTDLGLIDLLGLSRGVQRVHVGFMGCHGAINGLSIARALAAAGDGGARVLVVCVELCTIHLHVTDRADRLVANALFADGAAACVVARVAEVGEAKGGVALLGAASNVFPDSAGAMAWEIGDHGFEMTLAESVPGLIREGLRPWLAGTIERFAPDGRARGEGGGLHWCVHPGGPRVLDAVRDGMGLEESALGHSRAVLSEHGNMSSATVLFILERLRASGVRGPAAMLAFGPGGVR